MLFRPSILLLLFLIGFGACKSQPKATTDSAMENKRESEPQKVPEVQRTGKGPVRMISIEKTACFGTCPIYKAEIWSDQRLVWFGERFVEPLGDHEIERVPQTLIADILDYANVIGFHSEFDTLYESRLQDLPSTILSIMENGSGRVKKVTVKGGAPKNLAEFQEYVHKRITEFVIKEAEKKEGR